MKPYGTRRLKRLLREIGRMKYPEMRAFFDELGPQRTRALYLEAKALYDSENDQPGNVMHDPWASDHDLDIGMMLLGDEAT